MYVLRKSERGFTLPEVLVTILVMSILFTIATSSYRGIIEQRAVDSAANQLAADMRLAHNKATSRLGNWAIVTPSELGGVAVPGSVPPGDYYLVEVKNPVTNSVVTAYRMPERSQIDAPFGVLFKPNGSAGATPGGSSSTVTVSSNDGDLTRGPKHDINYVPATSRIKIEP